MAKCGADPLAPSPPRSAASCGFVTICSSASASAIGTSGLTSSPVSTMKDGFRNTRNVGGHDRQSGGHRFEHDVRDAVAIAGVGDAAWHGEHGSRRHLPDDSLWRHPSWQFDPVMSSRSTAICRRSACSSGPVPRIRQRNATPRRSNSAQAATRVSNPFFSIRRPAARTTGSLPAIRLERSPRDVSVSTSTPWWTSLKCSAGISGHRPRR